MVGHYDFVLDVPYPVRLSHIHAQSSVKLFPCDTFSSVSWTLEKVDTCMYIFIGEY